MTDLCASSQVSECLPVLNDYVVYLNSTADLTKSFQVKRHEETRLGAVPVVVALLVDHLVLLPVAPTT